MRLIKFTICLVIFLSLFCIAHNALAVNVYYSVGQTNNNLGVGSSVTVSGTTATFTVAQTGNIGVGDVITYDTDSKKCYITGKTSATQWSCLSATGGTPTAAVGVGVSSIQRAFTSLSAAEAGISGSTLLNTSDLTPGPGYILNIPCYYDTGPDTNEVTINGYTTSVNNYIRIYTPQGGSESNQSQRHNGKWDDSKYRLNQNGSNNVIDVVDNNNNVKIIGLQIEYSGSWTWGSGISANHNNDMEVGYNIIRSTGSADSNGINLTGGTSDRKKIYNNIVYDFNEDLSSIGIAASSQTDGQVWVYNNTVYGCSDGINSSYLDAVAKNNLSYNNTDNYDGNFNALSANNLSGPSPQSDAPGSNPVNYATVVFADEANDDFHLSTMDKAARMAGTNLSSDANLPFSTDIDGQGRAGTWDIGADEVMKSEVNISQVGLDSGLVLYQTFDGPYITGSTAIDSSGQNNNGLISGAVPAIGKIGQALNFDGVNDFINLGSNSLLNDIEGGGGMTVSAWIYAKDYGEGNAGTIFAKQDVFGAVSGSWMLRYTTDNRLMFRKDYATTDLQVITSNDSAPYNTWLQVTVTWTGGGTAATDVKIYINGSEVSHYSDQDGVGIKNSDASNNLYIGNDYNSSATFNGYLDETRIYNRVLSPQEIAELYRVGQTKVNASQTTKATNGLVGMWSFDGADILGSTTAVDRSVSGRNGLISGGASPIMGKKGQALNFDGSDDYINLGTTSLDLTDEISLAAWVKIDEDENGRIMSKHDWAGASGNGWLLARYASTDSFQWSISINGTSWPETHTSNDSFEIGQWYYVVATYDGSYMRVFVDGVENTTGDFPYALTGNIHNSSTALEIGRDTVSGNPSIFDGIIDEVRVYDRALSAEEIGDLYRMGQATLKR